MKTKSKTLKHLRVKALLIAFCLLPFAFSCEGQIPSIGGMQKPYIAETGGITDWCSVENGTSSNVYNFTYDSYPWNLELSTNGEHIYVVGNGTDTYYQFDLSTPYDLSTISYYGSLYSSYENNPRGMALSTDGTKLYYSGYSTRNIVELDLSTPYDITTATYVHGFSTTANVGRPFGIEFSDDGTLMFVVDYTNKSIVKYTLSTAWDVTSASYDSTPFSDANYIGDIDFRSDGLECIIIIASTGLIYQYSLSTAYDLSTITLTSTLAGLSGNNFGAQMSQNGDYLYVVGYSTDQIIQYGICE